MALLGVSPGAAAAGRARSRAQRRKPPHRACCAGGAAGRGSVSSREEVSTEPGLSAPAWLVCDVPLISALQCGGLRTDGAVAMEMAAGPVSSSHLGHPCLLGAGGDERGNRRGRRARHRRPSGPGPGECASLSRCATSVGVDHGHQVMSGGCEKVAPPMSMTSRSLTCSTLLETRQIRALAQATTSGSDLRNKEFGPFAPGSQPAYPLHSLYPHSLKPHTWHFTHPSANSSCEPQSGHVPMKLCAC
jgi:hypothetical protein